MYLLNSNYIFFSKENKNDLLLDDGFPIRSYRNVSDLQNQMNILLRSGRQLIKIPDITNILFESGNLFINRGQFISEERIEFRSVCISHCDFYLIKIRQDVEFCKDDLFNAAQTRCIFNH